MSSHLGPNAYARMQRQVGGVGSSQKSGAFEALYIAYSLDDGGCFKSLIPHIFS